MQDVNWVALVNAIILLITAITLKINLDNQRHIAEMKEVIHEINGNIQQQLNMKRDKV